MNQVIVPEGALSLIVRAILTGIRDAIPNPTADRTLTIRFVQRAERAKWCAWIPIPIALSCRFARRLIQLAIYACRSSCVPIAIAGLACCFVHPAYITSRHSRSPFTIACQSIRARSSIWSAIPALIHDPITRAECSIQSIKHSFVRCIEIRPKTILASIPPTQLAFVPKR